MAERPREAVKTGYSSVTEYTHSRLVHVRLKGSLVYTLFCPSISDDRFRQTSKAMRRLFRIISRYVHLFVYLEIFDIKTGDTSYRYAD